MVAKTSDQPTEWWTLRIRHACRTVYYLFVDEHTLVNVQTVAVPHHQTVWWKEAVIFAAFYSGYTVIRNQFGSALVNGVDLPVHAFTNAMRIIDMERWIGLYHEESIQDFFLPHLWLIRLMNAYYGTAHFFVTLTVFIILYRKRPDVFPQWRNSLAAMTALAIIGFVVFPLMPPRLLDAPCPPEDRGGACIESPLRNYNRAISFGFVDTVSAYGGPWMFNKGPGATLSNQYAAMPSLHVGWASWCAFALWPLTRKRWMRVALLLYPAITLIGIVVTANHFWLDGVGGLIVFAVGFAIGTSLHNWNHRRLGLRATSHPAI
ncbi:MAG: phosphatase PAP2 family protein [Actinomycetota bacterium]